MNIKQVILMLVLPALLFLSACKQHKQIQRIKEEEKQIVITPSFSLSDSLTSHSFRYRTLSAKVNTDFNTNDGNELSLMITMRIINDSAIWMSVSPALGIEAARILFTRDTIKIMDRINGQYAKESYAFLKKYSETDITFEMIQNILCGNAPLINSNLITDSITKHYRAHSSENSFVQELLASKLFRILETILTDKTSLDTIKVNYTNFQYVESEYLPFDLKIEAHSKGKTVHVMLNYTSVSINSPVEIKFNIPSSYTKMNIK